MQNGLIYSFSYALFCLTGFLSGPGIRFIELIQLRNCQRYVYATNLETMYKSYTPQPPTHAGTITDSYIYPILLAAHSYPNIMHMKINLIF